PAAPFLSPPSLPDALPISLHAGAVFGRAPWQLDPSRRQEGSDAVMAWLAVDVTSIVGFDVEGHERLGGAGGALLQKLVKEPLPRSEEHTSELQSREKLVCR